ncbi:MAG: hypothetical protein NXI15_09065 [Gammaproteobacteria bacterium]|nr:hypothetical protein [Gammaproteobacteria bacterium]
MATEIDVKAGEFAIRDLSAEASNLKVTILSLNDSDPTYAPTTKIDFYTSDDAIFFSVGIIKLDGKQGITAFYSFGQPGNITEQAALVSNLNLGEPYPIEYHYVGSNRLNLNVAGRKFSMDVGAKPIKATYMVSGMVLNVEQAP